MGSGEWWWQCYLYVTTLIRIDRVNFLYFSNISFFITVIIEAADSL